VRENEMDMARDTQRGEEECMQDFVEKARMKETTRKS
jgi:hypothetical protein